ncbi:MAG: hypothetical protein IT374_28205, partial [Polyangiaceae bacterium]|nr:hypothetical protein [Polyangiaceae bacterium]
MRTSTSAAAVSARPESQSPISAVAAAAAAMAIVVPTLVALTHGWDYRLAVLLGALIAVGCVSAGRRCLPRADVAGRLSLEFDAAFAAVLFCVYAADWLDWRPFGLDDALAGLAVGLVLLVAGPVRRALRHASSAPGEASFALQLVAIGPGAAAVLTFVFADGMGGPEQRDFLFAGLAASLLLAWLGTAFALRRRWHGTACLLSALSGLVVFGLLAAGGVPQRDATLLGVLAGAWPLLAVLYLGHESASTTGLAPLEGLLVLLGVTLVVSLLLDAQVLSWFAAAALLATWWSGYYRRGLPLFLGSVATPGNLRRTALSALRYGSLGIACGAYGLLFTAGAANLTGAMLLSVFRDIGP